MAYDRNDGRDQNRGYRDDRQRDYRSGGDHHERGFFDRAIDSVTNFFSDDDSGRRDDRGHGYNRAASSYDPSSSSRDRYEPRAYDEDESRQRRGSQDDRFGRSDRSAFFGGGQSTSYGRGRDEGDYRNQYGQGGGESGGFGRSDYGRQGQSDFGSAHSYRDRQQPSYGQDQQSRGYQSQGGDRYRPITGDYGRGSGMGGQDFGQQQYGSQDRFQDQGNSMRSDYRQSNQGESYSYGGWGDEQSRRQNREDARSAFGSSSSSSSRSPHDQHYSSWRQRQIEDLDRDYDEYCREHQSRFENEFSGFRQQRQTKRQMLGQIREHAEVVDESGQHIGTVDKVRGDKVILTKNDPEAGGIHRSFTCSLLERIEDGKVYLTGTKDSLRSRLQEERDEGQQGGMLGGLFGSSSDDRQREQASRSATMSSSTTGASSETGEGPHVLDRSFSGTYENDDKTK